MTLSPEFWTGLLLIDGLKAMILSHFIGFEDLSKRKDYYVEVHQVEYSKLD